MAHDDSHRPRLRTRCDISVKDVGAYKYAAHPSHEILCVGWRVKRGGAWGSAHVAVVQGGADGRRAIERRVEEKGRVVATLDEFFADYEAADVHVAHNVGFELVIEERHFPHLRPLDRWASSTAARSRRLGLPGALADVCRVLRTPHQKSEEGHAVMLQVSQPRPVWRTNPALPKWFDDAYRLAKTAVYCADDILAECDLDDYLPELPPKERLFWEQSERCNRRGIRLDLGLLGAMAEVVEKSGAMALAEARRATGDPNFNLTNVEAIKSFCANHGVYLDDLRAATVEAKLAAHVSGARRLPESVVTVLYGRQQSGGKSSNAKLAKMKECCMDDGYVRDSVIYHGAHTGRTTGGRD